MPDINMQVFEETQRNQLVTEIDIQTPVALNDYQVQLSDIANPTQSQDNVVIDRFGEFLSHWNESLDFDTWVKMSMEVAGKKLLLIHGNAGLSSVSSIDETMLFGDNFPGNSVDASKWEEIGTISTGVAGGELTITTDGYDGGESLLSNISLGNFSDFVLEGRKKSSTQNDAAIFMRCNDPSADGDAYVMANDSAIAKFLNSSWSVLQSSTGTNDLNWHDVKFIANGNSLKSYQDGTLVASTTNSDFTTGRIGIGNTGGTRTSIYSLIFLREYTAIEPTYSISTPKNIATALKALGRAG